MSSSLNKSSSTMSSATHEASLEKSSSNSVSSSQTVAADSYLADSSLKSLDSTAASAKALMTESQPVQWHSETSTLTTTSTCLPPMSAPMPPVLSEEITKQYLPSRSTENVRELISQLEKISLEIDMYAKAQQDVVSKEAVALINECMQRSKLTQDALTKDVHLRTQVLDEKYQKRREDMLKQLDVEKAAEFATLQQQFLQRQEEIQNHARQQVDLITQQAKQRKLEIVSLAQAKHSEISTNLTQSVHTFDASTSKLTSDLHSSMATKSDSFLGNASEPRATTGSDLSARR